MLITQKSLMNWLQKFQLKPYFILQIASWKLNFRTKQLICSPETLDLLGFPKSHQITFDALLRLAHSDDLQLLKQFMNQTVISKRESW